MPMLWDQIKESLRNSMPEHTFTLWIEPLKCVKDDDSTLRLGCPDRFFKAWVNQNYLETIQEKSSELTGRDREICLCEVAPQPDERPAKKLQRRFPEFPAGKSRSRSLHPRYTFDEFIVGDSNILAQSACKTVAAGDDAVGPCLFLNSTTGLGKSHLSHAVAHQILSESPTTRLHYLTATQFSQEMIRGIRDRKMDQFKTKYHDHCDVLLVEDVHTLTGKLKTQEELNELLDSLIKKEKKVIFTANIGPRELEGIDNEFRSRMSSGLVTTIQAPDNETRTRIVEKKAKSRNLRLNEDQINYLAHHIMGDVRQIESAILNIHSKAVLRGGHVDMDLVYEVVETIAGSYRILTAQVVSEFVADQFKVNVTDMKSRSRKKVITFPRQVAMYLARKHTSAPLTEIGRVFNRDHSTVMHSINKINDLARRDTSVGSQLKLLSDKVRKL